MLRLWTLPIALSKAPIMLQKLPGAVALFHLSSDHFRSSPYMYLIKLTREKCDGERVFAKRID